MKGKTLTILGILAAIAGAVLIISHTAITAAGVVLCAGILFMAVGLVNLIFFNQGTNGAHGVGRLLTQISNAGAIVLGLSMIIFQGTFTPLITFIFGLLIAVCAIWQFFLLALGTRPYQLPGWLYIFPLLIAGASVFVFLQRGKNDDVMLMLSTGIGIALLGLACIIEGICLGSARRSAKQASNKHPEAPVIEDAAGAAPSAEAAEAPATAVPEQPRRIETTEDLDDTNEG